MTAAMSYGIGGGIPTVEVNGNQMTYFELRNLSQEKEVAIEELNNQLSSFDSALKELEELQAPMIETIETVATITYENHILIH